MNTKPNSDDKATSDPKLVEAPKENPKLPKESEGDAKPKSLDELIRNTEPNLFNDPEVPEELDAKPLPFGKPTVAFAAGVVVGVVLASVML